MVYSNYCKKRKIWLLISILFFLCCKSTFSQNFWLSAGGPAAGNLTSLAFDSSTSLIYAGTSNNGIYKSLDNSNAWTQINSGLTNINVNALIIYSSGHIFAGTFGGGVFHSTDHGESWTSKNSGLTNPFVYCLAISPNGYIYAGTGQKVFRTTNNGNSWTNVSTGFPSATITSLAVNSNGHIFATTLGSGLYRSTNNGDLWVLRDSGITNPDIKSSIVVSNGFVFAGTFNGVYRSVNNADTWIRKDSGVTNVLPVYAFTFDQGGNIYIGKFGGGIFKSTDNGNFWTQENSGLTSLNVTSFTVNANGNIFAGTSNAGVFKSINTITNLHQSGSILYEYTLSQNYPNPFNPVTNLEFGILKAGFVSLKIYNILGKEEAAVIETELSPGTYKINFDASGLASGIYIYKLESGGVSLSRRMVLLK